MHVDRSAGGGGGDHHHHQSGLTFTLHPLFTAAASPSSLSTATSHRAFTSTVHVRSTLPKRSRTGTLASTSRVTAPAARSSASRLACSSVSRTPWPLIAAANTVAFRGGCRNAGHGPAASRCPA